MFECGRGPGFVLEPHQLLLVEHGREREHFQGHAAAERNLFGLVHDAHAAATELAEDAEIAQVHPGELAMIPSSLRSRRSARG